MIPGQPYGGVKEEYAAAVSDTAFREGERYGEQAYGANGYPYAPQEYENFNGEVYAPQGQPYAVPGQPFYEAENEPFVGQAYGEVYAPQGQPYAAQGQPFYEGENEPFAGQAYGETYAPQGQPYAAQGQPYLPYEEQNDFESAFPVDVQRERADLAAPKTAVPRAESKGKGQRKSFREALYSLLFVERENGTPSLYWSRIGAGIAALGLAVFGLMVGLEMAQEMMRNEEDMKSLREQYYAENRMDLFEQVSRVDLLPPGETFTPDSMGSNHPQNAAVIGTEQAAPEESAPAENHRSRQGLYANNELGVVLPEFEALQKENPDIIGQLVIEGVLEQLVTYRNNTYYLTRNAKGGPSPGGAVFMDQGCTIKKPPENLILRGQGSRDGEVFTPLYGYRGDLAFLQEHALFQMSTLYEAEWYVIFAVLDVSNDPQNPRYFNYGGYPSFQSDREMWQYLARAIGLSQYEIPVDILPTDRLLTLSTLESGAEQSSLVIMARKLRPGENPQSLMQAIGNSKAR